jgi:hypothetical protein
MVTNYPQQLTASRLARRHGDTHPASNGSVFSRLSQAVRQWLCGLRGHDTVLHFEDKRVMLRCTSCGHDSPGWHIDTAAPRRVFHGDAERHLLRPRTLPLRRTA